MIALRTCEKGRFLGPNVHMYIILDIEKYLEHNTDQMGYYSSVPGPFPAENAACPGHLLFKFARQYPPFISKKGSHLAQDNECIIESTPGSGYVYIFTGNSYYMGAL